MNRKHRRTLLSLYGHPVSGNVAWRDVVALLLALGAKIAEREGSRVCILLNGRVLVQHRPHPSPQMDKGAVADMREYLKLCGITPLRGS